MNLTIPKPLLLSMLDSTARSVGQIGGSGMVLLSAAGGLTVTTTDRFKLRAAPTAVRAPMLFSSIEPTAASGLLLKHAVATSSSLRPWQNS